MLRTHPAYAESFCCIGSTCEDTCCNGWNVPIDRAAFEKYRTLSESPLQALILQNVVRKPESSDASPGRFAQIRMDAGNQCPMLSDERLCRIQTTYGAEWLSHACAIYPRIVNKLCGRDETALSLSCPEAARLVLLNPDLLARKTALLDEVHTGPWTSSAAESGNLAISAWVGPIRDRALALIQDRAYPLWQRMFLLGLYCRRLDAIAQGELRRSVPDFLGDFEASLAAGSLRAAMEILPVDGEAQLDAVLRLAGMMLHRSNVRPRFVDCIHAFTTGIGNGPRATLQSLAAQYALAHDHCYAPFFARHPHILENYLINTIIRLRFPFGEYGAGLDKQNPMTRQFALLAAQFALIRGLLIGVAGFHRAAFSAGHVIHTLQSASKHFEHHPEFLNQAHALLVERQLDGARGLAILLREVQPAALPQARPAVSRPVGAEDGRPLRPRLDAIPGDSADV